MNIQDKTKEELISKLKELQQENDSLKALKEKRAEELIKTQEIAHIGNWRLDFVTNEVVWIMDRVDPVSSNKRFFNLTHRLRFTVLQHFTLLSFAQIK